MATIKMPSPKMKQVVSETIPAKTALHPRGHHKAHPKKFGKK